MSQTTPSYDAPIMIADGVYWVGFVDTESGLHCNPYLIVDGDEAVVIDGGSRPDFPEVMMKILKVGVSPEQIKTLIYQHYDPDLCGSIPHFEQLIGAERVETLSHDENLMFIRHYAAKSRMVSLQSIGHRYRFQSGRTLTFHDTPYAHSSGSFVTFDETTGCVFSSDLFGSYDMNWSLYLQLPAACQTCENGLPPCPASISHCPMKGIVKFHEQVMSSNAALRHALDVIEALPIQIIAPQHGGVIKAKADIKALFTALRGLEQVGIDGVFYKTGLTQ